MGMGRGRPWFYSLWIRLRGEEKTRRKVSFSAPPLVEVNKKKKRSSIGLTKVPQLGFSGIPDPIYGYPSY